MDAHALAGSLATHWRLGAVTVTPLGGGMNSETWLVRAEEGTSYVVKRVALAALEQLDAGCAVAERLAASALVTGRPVRTVDGSLVARRERLALLEYVPGRELTGRTPEEQRWIARTLARAHSAGAPVHDGPGCTGFLDGLEPSVPGAAPPWVAPAVKAARAATDGLTVTWSVLHTDPAPEAFRHDDATGVTGLIDWAGACRGPVLYDVASAVMYLGGPEHAAVFLDTYEATGPLLPGELRHLDAFRRFRWAVQAAYFAHRLATNDLTGIADQSDNQRGLDHARHGLAEL